MSIRLRKEEKEAVIAALPAQRRSPDPIEEWRPIADFPGYEVSSLARVRSWRWHKWNPTQPKVLKILVDTRGYRYLRLRINNGYRNMPLHILVAGAFIGPRPGELHVRHLDGNKSNNMPDNLRYGTRQENEADKVAHGTHRRGERNPMSRLTSQQVVEIRVARSKGEACTSIARRYGVSHQCISDIANGRRWAT